MEKFIPDNYSRGLIVAWSRLNYQQAEIIDLWPTGWVKPSLLQVQLILSVGLPGKCNKKCVR